jgi:hypothetical protein
LKRHAYPIPKIGEDKMIRSMQVFTFNTALDLNLDYFHIKIDANAQNLCKFLFPWHMGKIQIQTLTHGFQDCLVPDVFQNVMSKLVRGMEYGKTNFLPLFFVDTNV